MISFERTFDDVDTIVVFDYECSGDYYKLEKRTEHFSHYRNLFTIFGDKLDLILVKVNYENFIKNSQSLYEEEADRNSLYNEIIHRSKKEPKSCKSCFNFILGLSSITKVLLSISATTISGLIFMKIMFFFA